MKTEYIEIVINEITNTQSKYKQLQKSLLILILLLQNRKNYKKNKRIFPTEAFEELVNYILIKQNIVSFFDKNGEFEFSEKIKIKRCLNQNGLSTIKSDFAIFLEEDIKKNIFIYDVAISFAGINRTIAEELATCLKEEYYLNVFYDDFEKMNLWGKDLYNFLYDVYSDKSRYCVVLLSQEYFEKIWTAHELKAIHLRLLKEKKDYLLPIKVDDCELPKEFFTVSYLTYNKSNITDISFEINEKVWKQKRHLYLDAEDLAELFGIRNTHQIILNELYKEFQLEKNKNEFLIKLILSIVFLNHEYIKEELRPLIDYLIFSLPVISKKFENDIYTIIEPNGIFQRNIQRYGLVTNDSFWKPIFSHYTSKETDNNGELE